MSRYAVHVLLGVVDGHTEEATVECADLDAALDRIRECVTQHPDFLALSLLHVEDLPRSLEGSQRMFGG